jgi:hypothetical protein
VQDIWEHGTGMCWGGLNFLEKKLMEFHVMIAFCIILKINEIKIIKNQLATVILTDFSLKI